MTTNNIKNTGAGVTDLRSRRLRAGMTQTQLAVAADLSLQTVRNAENGLRVSSTTSNALERVLSVVPQAA